MKSRRRLALGLAVAIGVSALLMCVFYYPIFGLASGEPFYKGMPASYYGTRLKTTRRFSMPPNNQDSFQWIDLAGPPWHGTLDDLVFSGDPRAVPVLLHLYLKDKDFTVQCRAGAGLDHVGPDAVPCFLRAMKGASDEDRRVILSCLLNNGDPVRVRLLINALSEDDRETRLFALMALGEIGPRAKQAVPILTELASSKDEAVARESNRSLRYILMGE